MGRVRCPPIQSVAIANGQASHEFEWKREECYLIRKPDPPVLVAITKEPSGRLKTHSVQLLDYNINRFDIEDRKGLEITILTALLTFQDANEAYHTNPSDNSILPNALRRNTTKDVSPTPTPPPPLPTKPPAKTGVDRVAELQALRGEYNEVVIEDECDVADYAQYSWNLLQDDAILFVSILASDAPQVPKVLQTVEETKRMRYRAANMEELHQYVVYDTLPAKGPRRINLDSKDKYEAPKSILVHLSKIPMPELQPKPTLHSPPSGSSAGASGSTLLSGSSLFWRRDKGKEKEKPKEDKSACISYFVRTGRLMVVLQGRVCLLEVRLRRCIHTKYTHSNRHRHPPSWQVLQFMPASHRRIDVEGCGKTRMLLFVSPPLFIYLSWTLGILIPSFCSV